MRSVSPKPILFLHATLLPSMGTIWPCPLSYCAFPPCHDTLWALCPSSVGTSPHRILSSEACVSES